MPDAAENLPDGTDPTDPVGSFPHIPYYAIGCTLDGIEASQLGDRMTVEQIGVSALGAMFSHQVSDKVSAGLTRMGIETNGAQSHSIPDLKTLPAPVRELFESAYGSSIGEIFLVAVPFAVLALVAILFIREVPLRTSNLPEADESTEETAMVSPAGASAR